MNYNEYNNKCNKYLTSELNKKYKVFYSKHSRSHA